VELQAPDLPLADGRILLRPWRLEDATAIVAALDGDELVSQWLDQIPQPYLLRDARQYLEGVAAGWRAGEHAGFAIVDAAANDLLGSIGVRSVDGASSVAEVGYWIAASARGRGIATAALRLVSRWALETAGVKRLQLRAATRNLPSQRVAERAGFTLEGVLRSAHWNDRLGERVDWAVYSLLPGELQTSSELPS